ncbi:MAG: aminotransferase class I/II-fold pyridoxal phosphate-dependent enzyme [Bacteroidetes bacterium]|nr:aminotransferase class I/II-fold pyridoxal phosphate-dependent enzyme [Bacteroidota bacterium]
MDTKEFKNFIIKAVDNNFKWSKNWENFKFDDSIKISKTETKKIIADLQNKLNNSYPFFHPSYMGQMITPPHPIAIISYLMALQINPNNHALDGGPATTELEIEVIKELSKMFGYKTWLGHLTASGTIANLEALWIAREINPKKKIAFSTESHYSHKRICQLLRVPFVEIKSNQNGKIDLEDLKTKLKYNSIGTLVINIGTTGFGALDNLKEIIPLAKIYNVRLHADAAYGGFFKLLSKINPPEVDSNIFDLLNKCDSVVIDPHKRGLQPYGCGCVIYRDNKVGKFFKHDSPYTYFTSQDVHLGELTFECSRSGAAAASLWATLKAFPLEPNFGLGKILSQTRSCALKWDKLINKSDVLNSLVKPELDIVTYYARTKYFATSQISNSSENIFNELMNRPKNKIYLAKYKIDPRKFKLLNPKAKIDSKEVTILRSVFMKPEHNIYVQGLFNQIEAVAQKYI